MDEPVEVKILDQATTSMDLSLQRGEIAGCAQYSHLEGGPVVS